MKTIIVGAGVAGLAAAIIAAKNGADVLLIESESTVGGDLFSGMPLLGAYTSLGDCCVHGVLDEIINTCKAVDPDGYIGPVCDWRTVYGLCSDPEILRLAVFELLKKYNVKILLNSTVIGVDCVSGSVKSIRVATRNATHSVDCGCVVDATGGGNITSMTGGEVYNGDEDGQFQPMSLLFRMADVQFEPLLRFIRDNPSEALLSENPVMRKTPAEAALAVYEGGYPYVAIAASGKLLGSAIKDGDIHQCTATFITPTSMRRGEVCVNATRIAGIDCTDDLAVSAALLDLSAQVANLARFFQKRVPGFSYSSISSIGNRVGVRETGRIKGEYILTQNEVVEATRHSDCIAKGAHHVDIHGAGTAQIR
ncbi:MAG: FAD-dependent oxidoreductase, partial [Victivallales bacterium]|nr:FAD-dependent oxidoreductase [Victivallales bacterium]